MDKAIIKYCPICRCSHGPGAHVTSPQHTSRRAAMTSSRNKNICSGSSKNAHKTKPKTTMV